jgi:hypothetical protein
MHAQPRCRACSGWTSGSIYVLEGSMLDEPPMSADCRWPITPDVLAAFKDGFPTDWKERLAPPHCLVDRIMNALTAGETATVVEWLNGGGSIDVLDSEVTTRANVRGRTALMLAAALGRPQIVDVLLERKARVDVLSSEGDTALIVAAHLGHATVVRRLLEAGAEMNFRSPEGCTALDYAMLQEHPACVHAFREHLVGRHVFVTGTSRADLNGAAGMITGFVADKDRYYVELGDGRGTKLLKPEHVKLAHLPSLPHVSLERAKLCASNAHRGITDACLCTATALKRVRSLCALVCVRRGGVSGNGREDGRWRRGRHCRAQ